tara:strand:+ start:556 stop:729 length:174 start_codon:yes stop_codon:yes gene_type:complete
MLYVGNGDGRWGLALPVGSDLLNIVRFDVVEVVVWESGVEQENEVYQEASGLFRGKI